MLGCSWPKIARTTRGSGLPGSGLPRDHFAANRITGQGGPTHKVNRQTHTRKDMISHLTFPPYTV